jgi:hypothetical protein
MAVSCYVLSTMSCALNKHNFSEVGTCYEIAVKPNIGH